MSRRLPLFFEQNSEELDRRIAVGLHKLGLAMKNKAWSQAAVDGLSPTQGQILAALGAEGSLSGSELATRLGVSLPTVSDAVKALAEKGTVERRPDPRHPRASLLSLTAEGRVLAGRVSTWPDFLATAAAELDPEEQRAFFSGVVKMIRALQERGEIPVSRMCVTCSYFRPRVHDGPLPHHCAFVDAPLADHHLRVDCAEHAEATPEQRRETWARFTARD